ncbi:MAG TPA: sigma-70 family RNA polymerase sigma factor [Pseudomonadota bacterium]|jgi:RNA polymerase sigma-70 factor (ECF subfamily)|nr:sigma-70 family RNA polymerase sigma factor [Deltaproteobacteria bacterium]HPH28680.1 sigma-70 family RNA polymerase sigma factor [Pseudomonadota bacterium]
MFERITRRSTSSRSRFEQEALGHLGALYGTALRLTHNQRDAEDLVQDTLLYALRSFEQFAPGTQCKAWMFKILTNTFINKYRRRVLERSVAEAMERAGETGIMSSGGVRAAQNAEESLQFALMSQSIQKALSDLPEEFRLAVVLCDVEEFSYREIADIMDCPVGTVMSRLYRGRRLLQSSLREHAERSGIVKQSRVVAATGTDGGGQVIPLPRRSVTGNRKP